MIKLKLQVQISVDGFAGETNGTPFLWNGTGTRYKKM